MNYRLLIILLSFKVLSLPSLVPGKNTVISTKNVIKTDDSDIDQRLEGERSIPSIPDIGIRSKKLTETLIKTQNVVETLKNVTFQNSSNRNREEIQSEPEKVVEQRIVSRTSAVRKKKRKLRNTFKLPKATGLSILSSDNTSYTDSDSISLPSGSYVVVELKAGFQLDSEGEDVDGRIIGAFVGPNRTMVELDGCSVWLSLRPKMNKRRAVGSSKTISCRGPEGFTEDVKLLAQVRDFEDEYIGIKASLNLDNLKIAGGVSFVDSMINRVGNAMATLNVTQNVTTTGSDFAPQKTENVTGNKAQYMIGKAISSESGKFIGRVSDMFWEMRPTLDVPPGTLIFLSVKEKASIPYRFFKGSGERR